MIQANVEDTHTQTYRQKKKTMEASMNAGISAPGRPCMLVARFLCRHAHPTKLHNTLHRSSFVVPFRHFTAHCHNACRSLSSSIQEDVLQNNAGARMIKVKFILRRRCEFGQQFYVIGDNERLGGWALEAALPMQWSEGHTWTAELDLESGTFVEYKVLLKAGEVALEWLPGPNRKLGVLDNVTAFLSVYVPWSHKEEKLDMDTSRFMEMEGVQRIKDIVEIDSSTGNSSHVMEYARVVNSGTDTGVSLKVEDQIKTAESDRSRTLKVRVEDSVHQSGPEEEGLSKEDGGVSDGAAHPKSADLSPEEFFSLYPIPESWYVEECRDFVVSHDFTEPLTGLLEVTSPGRNLTSATKLYVNNKEEAGDKPHLLNREDEISTDAMELEADIKHSFKDKQLTSEDVQAVTSVTRHVETMLLNSELGASWQKGNPFSKEVDGKLHTSHDELAIDIGTSSMENMVSSAGTEDIGQGNALSQLESVKQYVGEDDGAHAIAPMSIKTIISNAEPDEIQQSNSFSEQVNGKQPSVSMDQQGDTITPTSIQDMISKADSEIIQQGNAQAKEERGKPQLCEDEQTELIAPSSEGIAFANIEPEEMQQGNAQELASHLHGLTTAPRQDFMIDPCVLENGKSIADEDPASAEVEEFGILSVQGDPVQSLDTTKPAKEQKRGCRGWSKLWNAFVRGHNE